MYFEGDNKTVAVFLFDFNIISDIAVDSAYTRKVVRERTIVYNDFSRSGFL